MGDTHTHARDAWADVFPSTLVRRVDHHVLCRRSDELGLVPRTAALLIGDGAHINRRTSGWNRVDHRSDDGRGSNYGSCRHRCRGNRVITATATTIAVA